MTVPAPVSAGGAGLPVITETPVVPTGVEVDTAVWITNSLSNIVRSRFQVEKVNPISISGETNSLIINVCICIFN